MNGAMFAFPIDVADEGVTEVFDRITGTAGLDGIIVAANYHAARDVFPHNPKRITYFTPGGSTFVPVTRRRYAGLPLQPRQDPLVDAGYGLGALRRQAHARGLQLHAWVNYCHQDLWPPAAGTVVENAFGDPDEGQLCPASPVVLEYLRALTEDIVAAAPDSIIAETAHFLPVAHGYHHERWFVGLDQLTRLLLGLCFCPSCQAAAEGRDIDVLELRNAVQRRIRAALAGATAAVDIEPSLDQLVDAVGTDLQRYLESRSLTVASLVHELRSAMRHRHVPFVFIEPAGAVKGYITGTSDSQPGPLPWWRLGIDLSTVAATVDGISVMGYVQDCGRLDEELRAYRGAVGTGTELTVTLRAGPPDCASGRDLAEKVTVCRAHGVRRVDFYHYAFTPLSAFSWIQAAVHAGASVLTDRHIETPG